MLLRFCYGATVATYEDDIVTACYKTIVVGSLKLESSTMIFSSYSLKLWEDGVIIKGDEMEEIIDPS